MSPATNPTHRRDYLRMTRAQSDVNDMMARAALQAIPQDEKELRAEVINLLKVCGWFTRDLSQRRRVEGGLIDFVDIVAVKHGVSFFIETKHGKNKLRKGQQAFRDLILEHAWPRSMTIYYLNPYNVKDIERALDSINWLAISLISRVK